MDEAGLRTEKAVTRGGWKQNPAGVQANIIAVATAEFAQNGLSGARMDEIAAKTRTSKRMIYYYFGDKDGLYRRVLEDAYRKVREGEQRLDLKNFSPADALRRLAEFTFDHHNRNPDFIRLVMIENIHHGQYLEESGVIRGLNATAIDNIASVYRRGVESGDFRGGLDPLELHWQVSALCFFNVSNRATFSKIFGQDMGAPAEQARLRQSTVEMVLRFVAAH